jgi:hypothetical protein
MLSQRRVLMQFESHVKRLVLSGRPDKISHTMIPRVAGVPFLGEAGSNDALPSRRHWLLPRCLSRVIKAFV